jgi:hypothetical protein
MHLFAPILVLAYALPTLAQRQLCSPNNGNGTIVPGTTNCVAECSIDRPGTSYRKIKANSFSACVSLLRSLSAVLEFDC